MQLRIGNAISFIGREALRIVLPSWCVVCRRQLPWRDRSMSCCGPCWRALPHIAGAKCRTCALPLPGAATGMQCIGCSRDEQPLEWCEAWGEYRDGLEAVIHAFKFQRHEFLAEPLAGLMADVVRDSPPFDAVVPVPMHRRKQRKRGYNQAALLAAALGRRLGTPVVPLLEKTGEKRTQSKLARADRAENVRNTFAAGPGADGKSILVVDDVCTTGETLRACARKLITAGAARVCAVTVAKAV